jgi:hypothetical protein
MVLFLSSSGHEIVIREKQPKKCGRNGDASCFKICFPSYTKITRKEQSLTEICPEL